MEFYSVFKASRQQDLCRGSCDGSYCCKSLQGFWVRGVLVGAVVALGSLPTQAPSGVLPS